MAMQTFRTGSPSTRAIACYAHCEDLLSAPESELERMAKHQDVHSGAEAVAAMLNPRTLHLHIRGRARRHRATPPTGLRHQLCGACRCKMKLDEGSR